MIYIPTQEFTGRDKKHALESLNMFSPLMYQNVVTFFAFMQRNMFPYLKFIYLQAFCQLFLYK